MEDYSFGEEDGDGDEPKADEPKDEDAPKEYSVEWPEGYEANEDLTNMVNAAARECGVTDKALGAYTAKMIEQLEAKQAALLAQDDADLKSAWGKDYLANKKAARDFMGRVMKEHGISAEEAKLMANPRGFKLLYALSQKLGSAPATGMERGGAENERAWAEAAMSDRSHPDHKALKDIHDPRHKEVTRRYFRAHGAAV